MWGDPWPEEPDDPFEEYHEPSVEDLGPSIPSPENAPKALHKAFWSLVAIFNIGLLAISLGAMLAVFRGTWLIGAALVGIGGISLLYGRHRYYVYRENPPW